MERKSQIRKVLRWSALGAIAAGGIVGLFLVDTDSIEREPCVDRVAVAMQGGLGPTEALESVRHARHDLQRRLHAHEHALGQVWIQPGWGDVEQQPWLQMAAEGEQSIIAELEESDSSYGDTQSCLEGVESPQAE